MPLLAKSKETLLSAQSVGGTFPRPGEVGVVARQEGGEVGERGRGVGDLEGVYGVWGGGLCGDGEGADREAASCSLTRDDDRGGRVNGQEDGEDLLREHLDCELTLPCLSVRYECSS